MNIDDKDKTIITMYAEDPKVSQEEMARVLRISQPSVAARIKKLREAGAIREQTGVEPFAMGLFMTKVDISTNNTQAILEMFRHCPYFANGFTVSGKHNLCLIFISENIATLEAIVNGHIRSNPAVGDVDFNIIISSEKEFIVPIRLKTPAMDTPPCGVLRQCKDCASFKGRKCVGCPVIKQYSGWLF